MDRFRALMGVGIDYFQIPWYDEYRRAKVEFRGSRKPSRWREHMPKILEIILFGEERNPVVMFERVMLKVEKFWHPAPNPKAEILRKMPVSGPWHHAIVPAILLACLKNAGYPFTERHVSEAFRRGEMIPEGSCGFMGVCGSAMGLGVALSVILGATPYHGEERSIVLKYTGRALVRLAREGGPRCSKLSSYVTILYAVNVFRRLFNFKLPVPSRRELRGRCPFWVRNPTCHMEKCMFNPLSLRKIRG